MDNNPETELSAEAKRGRGRQPGFVMSQEHRDKILNSNILSALISHVVDGKEMAPSQVTAGLGLLKKVMPDLQSMTLNGDDDGDPVRVIHKIERAIVRQP
jgi:hypothetical protein